MSKVLLFVFLVLMKISVASASLVITNDSISELYFGAYTYKDGNLYVADYIDQVVYDDNSYKTKRIDSIFEMPTAMATSFIAAVLQSKILSIQPNTNYCIDCRPFEISYRTKNGSSKKIKTILLTTDTAQRELIDAFYARWNPVTTHDLHKVFMKNLPDGEYCYNNNFYWKQNNTIKDLSYHPMILLKDKRITPRQYHALALDKDTFEVTTIHPAAATAIYGTNARYGAIIIRQK